ncbi:MAG: hypothetical protein C0502_04060 [Opitutus sp.]|nr:hypothetical protein [Opitutus sp.]
MSTDVPLSSFRVRPRFREIVPLQRAAARQAILASLAQEPADRFELRPFAEFIGIHIAEKDRRYWSPRLMLSLYDWPEGGTLIEGTYGPEIEVWSIFLYGYLGTGMLGTLSGIYGGAQLFIGQTPWAFYVTGTMAVIALVLYLAAQLGQKFAAHQTFRLHAAYERAVAPLRANGG